MEAHLAVADLAGSGVSAVEAHEDFLLCVAVALELLALDALLVHICRYGVVDVEQCHSVLGDASSDELRQSTIDIHLTCYRDTTASEAAVHIARNESEHRLEGRPALVGHSHELAGTLVTLNPVCQSQLVLSKLRQHRRNLVTCAKLCCHILHNIVDAWVSLMLLEGLKQVEL